MSAFKPPKVPSSLKIEQLRRAIMELRNLCVDLDHRVHDLDVRVQALTPVVDVTISHITETGDDLSVYTT